MADGDLDARVSVERFKGGGIGTAFNDDDCVRAAVLPNRFVEKAQRSFLVTMGSEQKVDGLAGFVNGTIKIFPLALILAVQNPYRGMFGIRVIVSHFSQLAVIVSLYRRPPRD
jgi:hypothetical protein